MFPYWFWHSEKSIHSSNGYRRKWLLNETLLGHACPLSEVLFSLFRIPKVQISEGEEGGKEIELSDDPYDCMRLNVENVPCIVSLCKVQHRRSPVPTMHLSYCVCVWLYLWYVCATQIGHRHVVDATLQEKACSVASVLISVTHRGTVTCVRKMGGGSLDPESIFEMTEVCRMNMHGLFLRNLKM